MKSDPLSYSRIHSNERNYLATYESLLNLNSFAFMSLLHFYSCSAQVAKWLVSRIPDRAVLVRALPGVIALCSYAGYFTVPVPLSSERKNEVSMREF